MFWKHWDPIGVNDMPGAKGEYDRYADEIAGLMINSSVVDESKIDEYLRRVMYDYMELTPRPALENKTEQFSKKLILFWQRIKT